MLDHSSRSLAPQRDEILLDRRGARTPHLGAESRLAGRGGLPIAHLHHQPPRRGKRPPRLPHRVPRLLLLSDPPVAGGGDLYVPFSPARPAPGGLRPAPAALPLRWLDLLLRAAH